MGQNVQIRIYEEALKYLEEIKPEGCDLEGYFHGEHRDYSSLKDIFVQFIRSAQNYQAMPKIINFKMREQQIREIFHDYDYESIGKMDPEVLYRKFRETFGITSTDSKRNSW